jgi:hypothetical protein
MKAASNKALKVLNELFDKYADKTEGRFHNDLWQIMVNGVRSMSDKKSCFYDLGTGVALVDYGKWGYNPANFNFKKSVSKKEREEIIEILNRDVFGLMPHEADEIISSSMEAQFGVVSIS